jgi:uncharacterized protein YodC (DUF2158 family)
MAFEPGDVITLRSGGHTMTVVSVGEEDIDCLWVSDDGNLFRQSIPAIALTVFDLTETSEDEESEAEDEDEEEDEDDDGEDDHEEKDDDEERGEKRRRKKR